MVLGSREFVFITVSMLAVTVLITGQDALGSSASNIFGAPINKPISRTNNEPMNILKCTSTFFYNSFLLILNW
jgi:hypothetical protein